MPEDAAKISRVRADILRRVEEGIAAGPFSADWESLSAGYAVPSWYADAKFGIFIHWGPYCVPGFGNEWYPREMYREGTPAYSHHRDTYGPQDQFGYKDFFGDLTGAAFDPDEWASLFRRAGAQFVVPVAEHHDGFAMYASELTRWHAGRTGPQRDVVKELSDAVRAQSMIPGASTHRAEHWWFFNAGMRFDSDVRDPEYADLYGPAQREEIRPSEAFLEDWLARTVEIVEHNDSQLVWFDWWVEQDVFSPWLAKFAAWYYNRAAARNRPVAINYKFAAFAPGSAVYDVERGQNAGIRPMLWQNDTSVAATSWGWVEGQVYKDIRDILGTCSTWSARTGRCCSTWGLGPTAPSSPRNASCWSGSGTGWRSTARRSTGRGRSRSAVRVRRRWRTRSSTTRSGRRSRPRTSVSPPATTWCTPPPSTGPLTTPSGSAPSVRGRCTCRDRLHRWSCSAIRRR